MLRVGPLIRIPSLIAECGHSPEAVLAEAEIVPEMLANPDDTMAVPQLCRLLAVCSRTLDCPHFGHLLGERVTLADLGLLGVLMRAAGDVEAALSYLSRYQRFQSQLNDLVLECGREHFHIYFREPLGMPGGEQLGDTIMSGLCSIMRAMCGPHCDPVQVSFAHARPADTGVYSRHFKAPLAFSQNTFFISYAARYLAKPLAGIDAGLLDVLVRHVECRLFQPEASFVASVYTAIETLIRSGQATAPKVAAVMGVSVRTLSRHLECQGLRFQKMLDEVCCRTAISMLDDPRMSIGQIAEFLGYKDVSGFVRAFRRWSGKTPVEWRTQAPTDRR
ncbi:MAG: AraC family transcriptional regulator [Rhodocyclales bacterium GT-UBC]|nr:MAG: AraC family transcriptional regulator [Rhodocyclales bacterium GT-UBC]